MAVITTTETEEQGLKRGVLSAHQVAFFVVAAAAPLGYAVGQMPLAIGRGGVGAAGMFIVCGIIFAVFAVGYVAMAKFNRRVGGMYLFIMDGLGRPMGIGAAFLAVIAYAAGATGVIGVFAVFAQFCTENLLGWPTPWQPWAFVALILMAVLGVAGVELNARVLGAALILETVILVFVAIVIAFKGGDHGLTAHAFNPSEIFGVHPGAAIALTMTAFAGFEATVLFSEEAKDGTRTIMRATFGAIAFLAIVYGFVCWAFVQAYGDVEAVNVGNADPDHMFLLATGMFVGEWAVKIMAVLVCTSWFASILAFHNAFSRYAYALGRDRVLPAALARTHPRLGSPWVASLTHSGLSAVALIAFMFTGLDPYLDLLVIGAAPTVIGLPVMEFLTSIAVFAYFWRDRRGMSAWRVLACPALAAAMLAVVLVAIISQIDILTARTGLVNYILMAVVVGAVITGIVRALWLRSRRPDVYAQLLDAQVAS
jgi:amino acid transporter